MTKSEIALSNFALTISTGLLSVDIGKHIYKAKNYSYLRDRLKAINQLHKLFNYEYGKVNSDINLLKKINFAINSLLNDYRLNGTFTIYEVISLPLLNDVLTLVLPNYLQTVEAGEDKEEYTNIPVTFNASIDTGEFPINSIQWTQISGSPATLAGATTANLTVSNYGVGESKFRIQVVNTEGLSVSDTVKLTGKVPLIYRTIFYGFSDTNPYGNEDGQTLTNSITIPTVNYTIPFTENANMKYLIIKEPITEIVKTVWINTDYYNQGNIPSTKMRAPVTIGAFRYYISKVPFALDGDFTITFKTN